jgi:hypothetical protein
MNCRVNGNNFVNGPKLLISFRINDEKVAVTAYL